LAYKKPTLIVCCAVTAFILLLIAAYVVLRQVPFDACVNDVKVVKSLTGRETLRIKYGWDVSKNMSYSVLSLREGQKILSDEEFVDDDGSLGKYRVEIELRGNVRAGSALIEKYPNGESHTLKDVPSGLEGKYNIRIISTEESALIIHLGSDSPIKVEETEREMGRKRVQFLSRRLDISMNTKRK